MKKQQKSNELIQEVQKELENPLPDPLDLNACDEFFEALASGDMEV